MQDEPSAERSARKGIGQGEFLLHDIVGTPRETSAVFERTHLHLHFCDTTDLLNAYDEARPRRSRIFNVPYLDHSLALQDQIK